MKHTARVAQVAFAFLLIGAGGDGATGVEPTKHPMLWRVDGESTAHYLFGTFHVGDERILALPDVVDEALDGADVVVAELALDELDTTGMAAQMMLPPDQSLQDVLPADVYRELETLLESLGMPMFAFDRMQVWAVNLSLVPLMFSDNQGEGEALDQVLYARAREAGKEVGGLETMGEQLDVFRTSSLDDQISMLRETVQSFEEEQGEELPMTELMIELYLAGRDDVLADLLQPNEAEGMSAELVARLVDERNLRMAERMHARVQEAPDKSHFFAVGALHMPGEKGIVAELRRRGYTVTRIAPPLAADPVERMLRRMMREMAEDLGELESRLEALEAALNEKEPATSTR